jgi:hypothetical protein
MALTNHDDCLMPRMLITISVSVTAVISAMRGRPPASEGQ